MTQKPKKYTKLGLAWKRLLPEQKAAISKDFEAKFNRNIVTLRRVFKTPDRAIGEHIYWLAERLDCTVTDAFSWVTEDELIANQSKS